MIRIDYRVGDRDHKLTIKGHAEYSDTGNDIVCAGVSAIAFTLIGFLENHRDDIESIGAQRQSGDLRIECVGGEKVALAFDMALIGLQQIAMKYAKHVQVNIYPQPADDSRE